MILTISQVNGVLHTHVDRESQRHKLTKIVYHGSKDAVSHEYEIMINDDGSIEGIETLTDVRNSNEFIDVKSIDIKKDISDALTILAKGVV